MEKIKEKEFNKLLKNLCEENWKIDLILKHNSYNFLNVPVHQQKQILKFIGIDKIR